MLSSSALLVVSGTLLPPARIIRFGGMRAKAIIVGMTIVSGIAAFLAALGTLSISEHNRGQAWFVLVVVYVPLAVDSFVLHRWYPKADLPG